MKRSAAVLAITMLVSPAITLAHVTLRPTESQPGGEERYTVRVPTEGEVTTTSVMLEIPDGVTVIEVAPVEGGSAEAERRDGRIVSITWKKSIPPKETAEFVFRARNPSNGTSISWKAHQHFADGSMIPWVGPIGDRRPGPVTRLIVGTGSGQVP
jgi:uncharacterized protein YcnI